MNTKFENLTMTKSKDIQWFFRKRKSEKNHPSLNFSALKIKLTFYYHLICVFHHTFLQVKRNLHAPFFTVPVLEWVLATGVVGVAFSGHLNSHTNPLRPPQLLLVDMTLCLKRIHSLGFTLSLCSGLCSS